MSLHIVKAANMKDAFLEIKNDVQIKKVKALYNWFEIYYVSGTNKKEKVTPPRFPPINWSNFVPEEAGFPRSDNAAEAFHRKLNRLLERHQNITAVINVLKGII